jgi:hypothetical protein
MAIYNFTLYPRRSKRITHIQIQIEDRIRASPSSVSLPGHALQKNGTSVLFAALVIAMAMVACSFEHVLVEVFNLFLAVLCSYSILQIHFTVCLWCMGAYLRHFISIVQTSKCMLKPTCDTEGCNIACDRPRVTFCRRINGKMFCCCGTTP